MLTTMYYVCPRCGGLIPGARGVQTGFHCDWCFRYYRNMDGWEIKYVDSFEDDLGDGIFKKR